jgi:sugar lactone lactonase YvrE
MISARGEVKVLDFGLAKMSRQATAEYSLVTLRTVTGTLMGTVEYMSPEQALGHEVDYRTDIFSLGVVLYQMATGQSPFAATGLGATIDRILHSEPEPISKLNPRIPPELERVIQKCLEKKREHRYQFARDLMADLGERRLMPASPTTIRDFIVRPQWVIAFGVIGLIVWMATIALILWQRPWKTAGNEPNRPVPTGHSVAGTSQPSPSAPAADTTNRSKETEAISVKGSNDATITNRTDSTTGSPPLATVAVASTTPRTELEARPVSDAAPQGIDAKVPTIVDTLFTPAGIALAPDRSIYLSDADGARIFKITPSGEVLTIAGTGIPGYSGDGGLATSAQLQNPAGIALDRDGNLYVADRPYRIRKITPAGIISTVVGTGYPGIAADGRTAISSPLSNPTSVAADDLGNLYFVEGGARIRKVTTDGMIDTVFGAAPGPVAYTSVAVNKAGDLYIANPLNSRILKVAPGAREPVVVAGTGVRGISGDEGPATSAQLSSPSQIAIDRLGNLYINDSDWRRIRKVTSDGIIHTIQPQSGVAGVYVGPTLANSPGLAIDANGDIYVVQAGNSRSVVRAMPDGRITPAVLWHGEVEPVVVGQSAKPISARATLNSDGHLSYLAGDPRIVLENAGRMDASVSLTPASPCKFEFGVARTETPASVLFSQKGAGPVLNVAGELESGTYNLVLWFQHGDTTCKNGTSLVLRYRVTVTPR